MTVVVFFFLDCIKVQYLPSLVSSIMFAPYNYLSVLIIFASMDIKDLSVLDVDEVLSLKFEDLPPS